MTSTASPAPDRPTSGQASRPGDGITVALFATCISDTMFPGTLQATVTVLERLGCRVVFPRDQSCCGQMFTNTGYYDEALPVVRTFVDAFAQSDYVVAPSSSCIGSVRDQHPMLARYADDSALSARVADVVAKTYDITEFLVDVLGVTDVGAYFPHVVTYHPTCHSLRVTRVGDRPYQLLSQVKGLTLRELPDADRCCGFGGTFALKNSDISVAMTSDKARNVASTGAEYLVTGDNSCLLNISGALNRQQTGVKSIHLVEILAQTEPPPPALTPLDSPEGA